MITQYPHILKVSLSTNDPSLVDGKWVFAETEELELECRAEPNGSGQSISTGSGAAVIFDYMVYLPLMTQELKFGSKCTVVLSETRQFDFTIKRQENGQLSSRIWL